VVAAVGAVMVAGFLLAGRVATQRRDRPARP
jgi:outer membrane murein-binding lipoprotein Lpp